MTAIGQLQLPMAVIARLLAGHRYQAARQAAAIEYRGGALENIDPLDEIGIDLQRAVGGAVAQQLLAIQIQVVDRAVGDAAHGNIVVAAGGAIGRAHQARCITQGLGHALGALVLHLLAGNHGHALGCFQQWHAGLGRHAAVGGAIAFGIAQRVTQ